MNRKLGHIIMEIAGDSASLDDLELYTDIDWQQWREAGERGKYLFTEEGDYIFRRGQFVRQGSWKKLKDGKHLLLEYQDLEGHAQHLMYRLVFLDEDILVLELPDPVNSSDREWLILLETSLAGQIDTEEELIKLLGRRPQRSGIFQYLVIILVIATAIILLFSLC